MVSKEIEKQAVNLNKPQLSKTEIMTFGVQKQGVNKTLNS